MVKYPEIEVELSGRDGNAFAIMAAVRQALRRNGVAKDEVEEYVKESTSGDYDNLLQVAGNWVTIW
jgi:hypothetical protein